MVDLLRSSVHIPIALLATLALFGPASLAVGPLTPAHSPDPAVVGAWSPAFDGEVPAVNLVLLHDGTVLYWSGVEADAHDHVHEATFFTATPQDGQSRVLEFQDGIPHIHTPVNPDGGAADLFCTGHTFLPDGRLLVAGGTDWQTLPSLTTPLEGTTDARLYDPATRTWSLVDDMDHGRWYPSVISLPDGTPLVASGITNLTHPHTLVAASELYDATADQWSPLDGGDNLLPMYPRLFVVPGGPLKGGVFYSTVGTLWGPFGEHPGEALWSLQQVYEPGDASWRILGPSVLGARQHAASVMLPLDPARDHAPEILTFGGSLLRSVAATNTAELADLASDPPTNTLVPAMENPRWHLNGMLLPDGNVLAVGGALYDNVYVHGQENVPVLAAELFDTKTRTWKTLAEMEVPRMYHSTALLLPDGRVLVGGHVPLPNPIQPLREGVAGTPPLNPQVTESRFEIFSPPYLFRGDRPVISALSDDAVPYGATFDITLDADIDLDQVMMMRPGATTHAFDMTARGALLEVVHDGGTTITVRAPADATIAPPGHYMVFVAGDHPDGPVPSEAAWITLG